MKIKKPQKPPKLKPNIKKIGNRFERMIVATCKHYYAKEQAFITKSHEPVTVTKFSRGRIKDGFFENKSEPDFKGTLQGGQSICFEAKHTSGTSIPFKNVKRHQELTLLVQDKLGAESFILITFNLEKFYKVPIREWMNLKDTVNKQSLNQKDLADYEINYQFNVIEFID